MTELRGAELPGEQRRYRHQYGRPQLDRSAGLGKFQRLRSVVYTEWNTATSYGFTGIGAWSVILFKAGKAFRYP